MAGIAVPHRPWNEKNECWTGVSSARQLNTNTTPQLNNATPVALLRHRARARSGTGGSTSARTPSATRTKPACWRMRLTISGSWGTAPRCPVDIARPSALPALQSVGWTLCRRDKGRGARAKTTGLQRQCMRGPAGVCLRCLRSPWFTLRTRGTRKRTKNKRPGTPTRDPHNGAAGRHCTCPSAPQGLCMGGQLWSSCWIVGVEAPKIRQINLYIIYQIGPDDPTLISIGHQWPTAQLQS